MDECYISGDKLKETINTVIGQLDVIWIASNANAHGIILSGKKDLSAYDDFTKFELSTNLRNCKTIVYEALKYDYDERAAFRLDVRQHFDYTEGLKLPPSNFPNGCAPIHVDTLEEAMKKMRQITDGGVLIIGDYSGEETLNRMNINWKRFNKFDEHNDFKEGESPYQHLLDGHVLVVDYYRLINGFEWPNIISSNGGYGGVDYHPCNFYMRCNTNLIIVDRKESDDEASSENENSELSETNTDCINKCCQIL